MSQDPYAEEPADPDGPVEPEPVEPEPDGPEPDGPKPDGPEPDGPEPDGREPDGPEPDGPEPDGLDGIDGRRYPSTVGGMFYLVVLLATMVGIGITWAGNWRLGTQWMGSALIAAAAVRMVLRRRDAGMLAVRHRLFDVLLLAGVGATMIFLASTIPNQPR